MQLDTDVDSGEDRLSPTYNLWLFAPFVALLLLAGYMGLRMGDTVSDTEIVTHFAAHYVAQTGNGAAVTDCSARPSAQEGVRLVVLCRHPDGSVRSYPSGPNGEFLNLTLPEGGA